MDYCLYLSCALGWLLYICYISTNLWILVGLVESSNEKSRVLCVFHWIPVFWMLTCCGAIHLWLSVCRYASMWLSLSCYGWLDWCDSVTCCVDIISIYVCCGSGFCHFPPSKEYYRRRASVYHVDNLAAHPNGFPVTFVISQGSNNTTWISTRTVARGPLSFVVARSFSVNTIRHGTLIKINKWRFRREPGRECLPWRHQRSIPPRTA